MRSGTEGLLQVAYGTTMNFQAAIGAHTSVFVPELDRLYIAVP
ncbi:MAG: hypothetical protein WAW96_04405 [Alphaproteobacteria bacterium]